MGHPIIDGHVHLKHGDAAGTEWSPKDIVAVMDAAGISRSVVFAISTSALQAIEMAQDAADAYPQRLIPFAYAIPSFERRVIDALEEAVVNLGFKGIKIHAGECRLTEYVVDPVVELAGDAGVPCLIDFGGDEEACERLATEFPKTQIIVAHIGRIGCQDFEVLDPFIKLAEAHPSLWIDVSGVVDEGFILEAVRRVGAHRIIFGTDGPSEDPTAISFAQRELNRIHGMQLSSQEKAMILGGSLLNLLSLA